MVEVSSVADRLSKGSMMRSGPRNEETVPDQAREPEPGVDPTSASSTAPPSELKGLWPGAGTLAAVTLLYLACLTAATYPAVTELGSRVSSLADPAQHLWIMHWYKTCLLEGRTNPFFCREIQYPEGAFLGYFSPLLLQSLEYLAASQVTDNDTLCYNIVWLLAFIGTGLATFILCWFVVRDRACAAVGGLLGMLSGPMMLHGLCHLDLIELGAFPLFLLAWILFVDAPSRSRLLAAAALYWLTVMSAAYFTLLATVPAMAYAAWRWATVGRRSAWDWLLRRLPWFAAFAVLALAGTLVLLSSQLWCIRYGITIARPRSEFETYHTQWYNFLVPTQVHTVRRLLKGAPYPEQILSETAIEESGSYLGLVAIGLLVYAAACRVRFPRVSFWWLVFGLLVVLSGGASWKFGPITVGLPGGWLWDHVILFRLIRAPARFNLLAAPVAAVLAAAGLRHLLGRLGSRAARGAAISALVLFAVMDLSVVPYGGGGSTLPPLPACYAFIKAQDPHAAVVDVPQTRSGDCSNFGGVSTYWQSRHRLSTTAGYSGVTNAAYDAAVLGPSPFSHSRLVEPGYLSGIRDGTAESDDFLDTVRSYLISQKIRYVVVHRDARLLETDPSFTAILESGVLDRLRSRLEHAKVFEDGVASVYDRERIDVSRRPSSTARTTVSPEASHFGTPGLR